MSLNTRNIAVIATPTSPLLPHLLHELSHQKSLQIIILTRETSVSISIPVDHSHHDHGHGTCQITHVKTDFGQGQLSAHLKNIHTVICHLTGSDIHLTPSLIEACSATGVKIFIPSEYGLDTSNPQIRSLLPPYQTRRDIQQQLKSSGMGWTAIYSGLVHEEAMKTDGALGIDCLWGSVVVFPHEDAIRVALSTYRDIAKTIVGVVVRDKGVEVNEIWTSSFRVTLDELVSAMENKLDKHFDRYEGRLEDAKREAKERMKGGYFDGGVALMGRVAVWDDKVDAWALWEGNESSKREGWEEEVGRVASMVRNGKGEGGCGC